MENKTLIKIEGHEVKESDVNDFIRTLGQDGLQFNNDEGKKQIALELMNQHLLYLDAKDSGLDQDPDFLAELEIAKEQILRQFSMKKVLESVKVDENDVNDYFEKNKDQFKKVYRYQASHILVDSEEKANEIKKEIEDGKAFEDLAKEKSTCPSSENGGDLGMFASGQMVPEFDQALESMEKDQISDPLKTQFGYHIIKLKNKELARDNDFDSNRNDIEGMLLGMKQQEAYLEKTNSLQEKYKVEKSF